MMNFPSSEDLDALWAHHHAEWRSPAQIASQWQEAADTDPELLRYRVEGAWWEALAACDITLLVTREYEHLVMAMQVAEGRPRLSYFRLPHPSGLAIDHCQGVIHIASTRNPNQVYDLRPITTVLPRLDINTQPLNQAPLVPVRSRFYPGCLYLHDLALIDGQLYANAVGHNAIVRLHDDSTYERVWYPRCIETDSGPVFGQNHIQLNSIAAGSQLASSYFSASSDKISARRPGHKNFPVDQRGVIFSGKTREPIVQGLTRPHSARLYQARLWVDNSGYGELGVVDGQFVPVVRLPGWTRGLWFYNHIAFVGTSRVIPRFRQYAPGLEVDSSLCGLHAVDTRSGKVMGSLIWPSGNQIFAIEGMSRQITAGFPFVLGDRGALNRNKALFYTFSIEDS
ncbi:MAG: DUF4915 domain-containing protein [Cyanobacteria bacterium P01_G01_bin.38]